MFPNLSPETVSFLYTQWLLFLSSTSLVFAMVQPASRKTLKSKANCNNEPICFKRVYGYIVVVI